MRSSVWRPAALVAIWLAALAGLSSLGYDAARAPSLDPSRSSYNPARTGCEAFFTLLQELGYAVRRHERDLSALDGETRLCFSAAPSRRAVGPDEARALVAWVRSGGTFVYLAGQDEAAQTALLRALGLVVRFPETWELATGHTLARRGVVDAYGKLVPSPYEAGVEQVSADVLSPRLRRFPDQAVPLFGDNDQVHALWLPLGTGRVIYLADARALENDSLALGDNLRLFLNVVERHHGGRPVAFDEYHHGHGVHRGLLALAELPVFRAILAQLGLLALAWLLAQIPRLGAVLPGTALPRAGSERTIAAGAALRLRAGLHAPAGRRLWEQFQAPARARLGLAPTREFPPSGHDLALLAERLGELDREAGRRALELRPWLTRSADGRLDARGLLALDRLLEPLRTVLGPRV